MARVLSPRPLPTGVLGHAGRRSLRDAKRIVEQLRGTFGLDKALTITTDRIETYKAARLAEGRAKATLNLELSALRRMFSLAVKSGRLAWRPTITMLDVSDNVREGFLEPAEFAAVRQHLPADVADAAEFADWLATGRGCQLGRGVRTTPSVAAILRGGVSASGVLAAARGARGRS